MQPALSHTSVEAADTTVPNASAHRIRYLDACPNVERIGRSYEVSVGQSALEEFIGRYGEPLSVMELLAQFAVRCARAESGLSSTVSSRWLPVLASNVSIGSVRRAKSLRGSVSRAGESLRVVIHGVTGDRNCLVPIGEISVAQVATSRGR